MIELRRGASIMVVPRPARYNGRLSCALACQQKFGQQTQATKIGQTVIRELIEQIVEVANTVSQDGDSRRIQSVCAVQIVHGTTPDNGIQRHELSCIGIGQEWPACLAVCFPYRGD